MRERSNVGGYLVLGGMLITVIAGFMVHVIVGLLALGAALVLLGMSAIYDTNARRAWEKKRREQ